MQGGEEDASGLREIVHPLFVIPGKPDKLKRFASGCFLLGVNVQSLLAAHGISAHGAQHLLENLDKLVAAARSSGMLPGI